MTKAPDIDYSDIKIDPPSAAFSCLHIGPYKIGIAVTDEDGEQDSREAGAVLLEFLKHAEAALKAEN
ncbi:MAG: hypothetical protein AAF720_00990 [Pseudomonadota bacterium]